MNADDQKDSDKPHRSVQGGHRLRHWAAWALTGAFLVGLVAVAILQITRQPEEPQPVADDQVDAGRGLVFANQSVTSPDPPLLTVWWGHMPERSPTASSNSTLKSNVRPRDYAGPESCRECHKENYETWSQHPHRWMNALATSETVKGDFSGGATISYLGGTATFSQEDGEYRMRFTREQDRTFVIHQTIGSRFFQYYIGRQVSGPAGPDHAAYSADHVLPFGYWLEQREWVPVVHIFDEEPDGQRMDPFDFGSYERDLSVYAKSCNACHTTFALGDLFCSNARQMAREIPSSVHWGASDYLADSHANFLNAAPDDYSDDDFQALLAVMDFMRAPEYAVGLGVSCEACHLGCQEHVKDPKKLPAFFPRGAHVKVDPSSGPVEYGRTHDNVNWACGRCHTGNRPQFAAGMSTWNSTEYSDAMRGSCYSQLRCIDCHNPHRGTGPSWTRPPARDDAVCTKCHEEYASPEAQANHSHHAAGTAGSHCMDCHMPRINEGIQYVVRTHTIFSPTQPDMIHENQPNACNLCHTDQPIDWTLDHLQKWYGATYDDSRIDVAYADRKQPTALGWLAHSNEAVRLVAADALARSSARWALPQLIDALDDPYLLNRQFARRGLEKMLGIKLADYGYRFYMTPEERQKPLADLRDALSD